MSSPSMNTTPRRSPIARDGTDAADDEIELFMRHSSPIDRPSTNQPSPLTVRNSSPSLISLSRPRSNPRNRTPMRFESPLGSDAYQIPEGEEETARITNEGRRITILPMTGSSRGTSIANFRNRQEAIRPVPSRSSKQGPSHRKVRRWNNDNFVNLAKEVGSTNAAEALLRGHAHASKYRSVYPHEKSENNVMSNFIRCEDDKQLQSVRDKFFEGELYSKPNSVSTRKPASKGPVTAEQRMNRIDKRLQHVVVRAIENSYPATMIMETFESFLLQAYGKDTNNNSETSPVAWKDILAEPPTVTKPDGHSTFLVIRFLFDQDSSTGGFHRLLLHALVQFHGLTATSSTTPKGRVLTATGTLTDQSEHKLVDSIMQKKEKKKVEGRSTDSQLEIETNRLDAVRVA